MKTTHTRISENALRRLDYLCGQTGDNRRDTIDRVVAFAVKELKCYLDRKKYQEVLREFGEPIIKNKSGYVCVIKQTGTEFYKIGKSWNPNERVKSLRSSTPHRLEIVLKVLVKDYEKAESDIHKLLEKNNHCGEWFVLKEYQISIIKKELMKYV